MFCKYCGNEFQDETAFCRVCGEQISKSGIILPKTDWLKRTAFFALGAGGFFLFIFLLLMLLHSPTFLSPLILLISSVIFAGIISVLLSEIRELRKSLSSPDKERQIQKLKKETKLIEEKFSIPAYWSVTDTTTENLTPIKKRITGDL